MQVFLLNRVKILNLQDEILSSITAEDHRTHKEHLVCEKKKSTSSSVHCVCVENLYTCSSSSSLKWYSGELLLSHDPRLFWLEPKHCRAQREVRGHRSHHHGKLGGRNHTSWDEQRSISEPFKASAEGGGGTGGGVTAW